MFKLNSVSREKTILSSGLVDGNHVFYIIVDNSEIKELHTFDADVTYTFDDLYIRTKKFEVKRYDIPNVSIGVESSNQEGCHA